MILLPVEINWKAPVPLSFHCTGRSGKLHHDLIILSDLPRMKLPSDTLLALDSAGLLPGLVFLLPDDDADEDAALPPDVADDSA